MKGEMIPLSLYPITSEESQSLGLQTEYTVNDEVQSFIWKKAALAFMLNTFILVVLRNYTRSLNCKNSDQQYHIAKVLVRALLSKKKVIKMVKELQRRLQIKGNIKQWGYLDDTKYQIRLWNLQHLFTLTLWWLQ